MDNTVDEDYFANWGYITDPPNAYTKMKQEHFAYFMEAYNASIKWEEKEDEKQDY